MNKTVSPIEKFAPGKPLTISGVPDGFSGVVVSDLARTLRARDASARLLVLCRDAERILLARALAFFARAKRAGVSRPALPDL